MSWLRVDSEAYPERSPGDCSQMLVLVCEHPVSEVEDKLIQLQVASSDCFEMLLSTSERAILGWSSTSALGCIFKLRFASFENY